MNKTPWPKPLKFEIVFAKSTIDDACIQNEELAKVLDNLPANNNGYFSMLLTRKGEKTRVIRIAYL